MHFAPCTLHYYNEVMLHFLLDGDGVLWRGGKILPHGVEFLRFLRKRRIGYSYVSNNSSRRRATTLRWFTQAGLPFAEADIFNTNYLAGWYLARKHADDLVLVIGHSDLAEEIRSRGVSVTTPAELLPPEVLRDPGLTAEPYLADRIAHAPTVVLVGIDTTVSFAALSLACRLIEDGASFICTNRDISFPAERGYFLPGNGAVVELLEAVTQVTAQNLGKPEEHLARLIQQEKAVSREQMVMVGDRLDTDIAFAARNGMRSVLMLTGIAGEALGKKASPRSSGFPEGARPTFIVRHFPDFMERFDEMFPEPG